MYNFLLVPSPFRILIQQNSPPSTPEVDRIYRRSIHYFFPQSI